MTRQLFSTSIPLLLTFAVAGAQEAVYTWYGEPGLPSDSFGESVSGAGDVNGDGFADVIVGRPGFTMAEVFSGRDGSVLYTLYGAGGIFGSSVSGAGDVNKDGFADVIVGAPWYSGPSFAQVFSGRTGGMIYSFSSYADGFGISVSGAGDVNKDGFADVIVGASTNSERGTNYGKAIVYSGSTGAVLHSFYGDGYWALFGWSVSSAGDVNRDGYADVIVGAPNHDFDHGRVRVFSGKSGAVLYSFDGGAAARLGHSVSNARDVNKDGYADFIIGGHVPGNYIVHVDVRSGRDGSVLFSFTGPNGSSFPSVSDCGDVDGDSYPDVIVGVNTSECYDYVGCVGRATVLSGLDGSVLFSVSGDRYEDRFATSVSGAGDMNGDGLAEFVVGAPWYWGGSSNAGYVRTFTGRQCDASWNNYGQGWPGTFSVPELTLSGDPVLGTTVNLFVGNSRAKSTIANLMIGLSEAYLPTNLDGVLLVVPIQLFPLAVPAVGLNIPVSIPNDGSFCGTSFYLQAIEYDPGASLDYSFTPGLKMILGD